MSKLLLITWYCQMVQVLMYYPMNPMFDRKNCDYYQNQCARNNYQQLSYRMESGCIGLTTVCNAVQRPDLCGRIQYIPRLCNGWGCQGGGGGGCTGGNCGQNPGSGTGCPGPGCVVIPNCHGANCRQPPANRPGCHGANCRQPPRNRPGCVGPNCGQYPGSNGGGTGNGGGQDQVCYISIKAWRRRILKRTNELRRRHGAHPLIEDGGMDAEAQGLAIEAARNHSVKKNKRGYAQTDADFWAHARVPQGRSFIGYAAEEIPEQLYNAGIYQWDFANSRRKVSEQGGEDRSHAFTQMVWKSSKKVGYGIAFIKDCARVYVTILYAPSSGKANENVGRSGGQTGPIPPPTAPWNESPEGTISPFDVQPYHPERWKNRDKDEMRDWPGIVEASGRISGQRSLHSVYVQFPRKLRFIVAVLVLYF